MSDNNHNDYLRRIDEALESDRELVALVEGIHKEAPWLVNASTLKQLEAALKGRVVAQDWLRDPILASWLPVVMADRNEGQPARKNRYQALLENIQLESASRRSHWLKHGYPFVLFLLVMAIAVLMLVAVVPTFKRMFSEFDLRLPAPTWLLFSLSDLVLKYPIGFLLFMISGMMVAVGSYKLFSRLLEWSQLSSVLGSLTAGNHGNVVAMSRFAGVLAEMVSVGAPATQSLRVAGTASRRLHLKIRSEQLAGEMESTDFRLADSRVAHNFPPLILRALIEEGYGKSSVPLLRHLATMYLDRSMHRNDWSSHFTSPLTVLLLGFFVGFVVLSLFMPLISLVTALA